MPDSSFNQPLIVPSVLPADSTVGFEAHLMVVNPDELLPRYIDAGCEVIIVHAEACTHLHRTLARIRELGARSGVALNPHTPAETVEHVLTETDLVLAMTVNPGFGGQKYIPGMERRIAPLRRMIDDSGFSIELEADGGITDTTIRGGICRRRRRVLLRFVDVFLQGRQICSRIGVACSCNREHPA